MDKTKKIKSALVSVYHKDNLDAIVKKLDELQVKIYSTGGTKTFIESLGISVISVETLTGFPSIFGGRVKTLHPNVFGGILYRRDEAEDRAEAEKYGIPDIDLVIVDLYPFDDTVNSGASEAEIIEKIDIGGVSLIRAAAKNYSDVVVIGSKNEYEPFLKLLEDKNGETNIDDRRKFAATAFTVTSFYDYGIFDFFKDKKDAMVLRYGENPHQEGVFFGDFDKLFDKIQGKELSYNNLLDIDAAVHLIADFKFDKPTFAILKHNNACGLATSETPVEAWKRALAGDPVSAFGGIVIANCTIDQQTALEIDSLFYEVLIAPDFEPQALETLTAKKNRILLKQKDFKLSVKQTRTILNGLLTQKKDLSTETASDMNCVTNVKATQSQLSDLEYANKIVKNSKSNAIVLVKNQQLIGSGVGQTSRVDALKQALDKARSFSFDLNGAVMASDAFFPFPDCVEIAATAGIKAIVQPGGSMRDNESIECCNKHNITMVLTGVRHFKH